MIDIDEWRYSFGINANVTPTSEDCGIRGCLGRALFELEQNRAEIERLRAEVEQLRDENADDYRRGFDDGRESAWSDYNT